MFNFSLRLVGQKLIVWNYIVFSCDQQNNQEFNPIDTLCTSCFKNEEKHFFSSAKSEKCTVSLEINIMAKS
jgi:hypothetical protein